MRNIIQKHKQNKILTFQNLSITSAIPVPGIFDLQIHKLLLEKCFHIYSICFYIGGKKNKSYLYIKNELFTLSTLKY